MTLRELSDEVCALGFDSYARLDAALVYAARRALAAIYRELRIASESKLLVTAKTPSSKVARLHHKGGGVETLPLSGKAYAMTVSGVGCVTVYDGASSTKISFDTESKIIKGFLRYGGKAVFSGSSSFDVFGIATWNETFGESVSSIPDGDSFVRINARERIDNFSGFTSPLLDSQGRPITSAILEDGMITLPSSFSGEIRVKYRRLPEMPSLSEPDKEIDIPPEYEILLPLLSAFYILLDEDAEKAETYRRSYLEMLEGTKSSAYSLAQAGYVDVNGWGR